jgi:hypothetical protein
MKYFNTNTGQILIKLPSKIKIDNKTIFSPSWEQLYSRGWRELNSEYNENTWKFDNGEYRPMTQQELDEKETEETEQRIENNRQMVWQYFTDFAEKQMDESSRHTISMLLVNPITSEQTITKIQAYMNWWQLHWVEYKGYRQRILNGEIIKIEDIIISESPYTIWDIVEEF